MPVTMYDAELAVETSKSYDHQHAAILISRL